MSAVTVPAVDTSSLDKEILPSIAKAKTMIVSNKEEHGIAEAYLKTLAGAKKFVTAVFAGPKAILDKAHKDMVADENKWLVPIKEAGELVKVKVLKYEDEEIKKAQEEERRKREEAIKLEETVKILQAEDAAAEGKPEEADAILEEEIVTPTIKVAPAFVRAAGNARPTYYRCKVEDFLELVKYVAANPNELALLEPAQSALDARAKSMKEGFKLPGCSLDKTTGLSVRA